MTPCAGRMASQFETPETAGRPRPGESHGGAGRGPRPGGLMGPARRTSRRAGSRRTLSCTSRSRWSRSAAPGTWWRAPSPRRARTAAAMRHTIRILNSREVLEQADGGAEERAAAPSGGARGAERGVRARGDARVKHGSSLGAARQRLGGELRPAALTFRSRAPIARYPATAVPPHAAYRTAAPPTPARETGPLLRRPRLRDWPSPRAGASPRPVAPA